MAAELRNGHNPLAALESWWGDALTHTLIDRISTGPREHYTEFFDAYMAKFDDRIRLPDLPIGRLRPILQGDLSPLIYAHEVAVFDPFITNKPSILSFSAAKLRAALEQMHDLAPLIRDGQVHYIDPSFRLISDGGADEPGVLGFFNLLRRPSIQRNLPPELKQALSDDENILSLENDLGRALADVFGLAAHSARHLGNVHITLTRFESEVLRAVYGGLVQGGPEALRAGTLVDLEIPASNIPLASMVRVRTSGDLFEECRQLLSSALRDIAEMPRTKAWLPEARAHVNARLAPTRAAARRELERAGLKGALNRGYRTIAISAIGAGTGVAVGPGSLATPLASGGSAGLASLVTDYMQGRESRRHARAVLDYCMIFEDDSRRDPGRLSV